MRPFIPSAQLISRLSRRSSAFFPCLNTRSMETGGIGNVRLDPAPQTNLPRIVLTPSTAEKVAPLSQFSDTTQADFKRLLKCVITVVHEKGGSSLEHFKTALAWFYDGRERVIGNINPSVESFTYYKIINRLALLAIERNTLKAEAKAKGFRIPEEAIGIIYTRHPCCPDDESYPLEGRISDLLEAENPDLLALKAEIKKLMELDHRIPELTLYREIKINHQYIEHMLRAVSALELEHSLPPRRLLRQRNWTGTEADRNANTRLVTILTKLLDAQKAIQVYCDQLKKMEALAEPDLLNLVLVIKARLTQLFETLSPIWRLVKTYAAWEIINLDPKKYKFVRDNEEQFFKPKAEDPVLYYQESVSALNLPLESLACLTEIEARLSQAFQCMGENTLKELDTMAKDLLLKATSPETKNQAALLKQMMGNAGLHLTGGQSRLDSTEAILHAAQVLMAQEPLNKNSEQSECEHLIKILSQDKISIVGLESLFALKDPEAQETINHFRSIALLNSANPEMIPDLVLANFSSTEDFLRTFYLAVKTGLVRIEQGGVISAQLQIIPLFESTDDHRAAGSTLNTLFSIPLIRSYFVCTQEVRLMSAYSDTPREDGMISAILAISFAGLDMHEIFQQHFKNTSVRYARQHGTGASFRRSGHAIGSDRERRATLLPSDALAYLRTWQSGELDHKCSTLNRSHLSLIEMLYDSKPSPHREQELKTPGLRAFLESLFEPGRTAFRRLIENPKGDFNQLLLEFPSTWSALLEISMGSRKKATRDIRLDKKSIICGERKITVTQVLEALAFDAHIIIPFYSSMLEFLGPPSKINSEPLKIIQFYYEKHPLVKNIFHKIEEGIYRSFPDVLKRYREQSEYPELIDALIQALKDSEIYLLQITQQAYLFEKRPGLEPIFRHQKEQDRALSRLHAALNRFDDPRSREMQKSSKSPAFFCRQILMGANAFAGRAYLSTQARNKPG